MTKVVVRHAVKQDLKPLAAMLAIAFFDEPFHQWLFPDEQRRLDRARILFLTELRNTFRDGVIYTVDDHSGASLWGPPGRPTGSRLSQILIPVVLFRLLGLRAGQVAEQVGAVADSRPTQPHWYLSVVGTAPGCRQRGIGSALLKAGLDRCDSTDTGAWLETASPDKTRFYGRFGFVERSRTRLIGGPEILGMWRAPTNPNQP